MSRSEFSLAALDDSIDAWVEQEQLKDRIDAKTRALFGADGSKYGYSREEARERATVHVMREPAANDGEE